MLKEICNFDNLVRGRLNFTTMSLKNVVNLKSCYNFLLWLKFVFKSKQKMKIA